VPKPISLLTDDEIMAATLYAGGMPDKDIAKKMRRKTPDIVMLLTSTVEKLRCGDRLCLKAALAKHLTTHVAVEIPKPSLLTAFQAPLPTGGAPANIDNGNDGSAFEDPVGLGDDAVNQCYG
jgi:hypothetical protein